MKECRKLFWLLAPFFKKYGYPKLFKATKNSQNAFNSPFISLYKFEEVSILKNISIFYILKMFGKVLFAISASVLTNNGNTLSVAKCCSSQISIRDGSLIIRRWTTNHRRFNTKSIIDGWISFFSIMIQLTELCINLTNDDLGDRTRVDQFFWLDSR